MRPTITHSFHSQPEISVFPVFREIRASWAGIRFRIGQLNNPSFHPFISAIKISPNAHEEYDDDFMFEISTLDIGGGSILELINSCKYFLEESVVITIALPTLVPVGSTVIQAVINVSLSKNGTGPAFLTTFKNCVDFAERSNLTVNKKLKLKDSQAISEFILSSIEEERVCRDFEDLPNSDYSVILGNYSLSLAGETSSLSNTEINKIIEDFNYSTGI